MAKLTAPRLLSVVNRTRLFAALDTARDRPIVWISSPAGSGKTTLVASYLQARQLPATWYQIDAGDNDPASFFHYLALAAKANEPRRKQTLPALTREYLAGLPVFARNFFRDLFSGMQPSNALVFDNYQDTAEDALLHFMLAAALEEIPAGMNVIVLSRNDAPAAFARLQASSRIAKLSWDDVRLTEGESIQFVEQRLGQAAPGPDVVSRLHQTAQGWAAGMVLLMEQAGRDQTTPTTPHSIGTQGIFDYFANESFATADPPLRDFLIKTSFLPTISLSAAQAVTSTRNASTTLNELARRNVFTTRCEGVIDAYQYHPLFRSFLMQRAVTEQSPTGVLELKRRCATALAQDGSTDAAITLFLETQDWSDACRLVIDHAPNLFEHGRAQTLAKWIQQVPEEKRNEEPWLLYWLGMCLQPLNPMAAGQELERAFALFLTQDDSAPLHLAWAAVLESYFFGWSDRSGVLKWLDLYLPMSVGKKPPPPDIELTSLVRYLVTMTYCRPEDSSASQHVRRAEQLLKRVPHTYRSAMDANGLALYYTERAEFDRAKELLLTFSPKAADSHRHPMWHIFWCGTSGIHSYNTGLLNDALESLTLARDKAIQRGVRAMDFQVLMMLGIVHLQRGDVATARAILDDMAKHPFGLKGVRDYYYSNLFVSVRLWEGNTESAVQRAMHSRESCNTPGTQFEYASSLRVSAGARAKHGDIEGALSDLAKSRAVMPSLKSTVSHFLLNYTEAVVYMLKGDTSSALRAFGDAVAIGKKSGALIPPAYCLPNDVAQLFCLVLDAGVHDDYIRMAIASMNLLPPAKYSSERWPWRFRIYTLGRFEIVKDNKPLRFEGKAQRRPLDLLKALIAFGGRKVSQEQLASVLWPDADGDAANASFTVALHRLRKLLGSDEVVQVENRELSLDARYLWVDAWAFERSVTALRSDATDADTDVHAKKILHHYHGAFLASDSMSWVVGPRERLRNKFLQSVGVVAERHQHHGVWSDAAQWYEKGIEVDPLAEELYFKLMTCYQKLDRRSDALGAYARCKTALASAFQIQPTRKVQALFEELRRSG